MPDLFAAARQARRGVGAAMDEVRAAIDTGTEPAVSLGRLREAWANHVAVTEADDGLLADMSEEAPHLARRVTNLRTEHTEINDLLAALGSGPDRDSIETVLTAIDRHRHRGAEVVYDAFNVDIAFGD